MDGDVLNFLKNKVEKYEDLVVVSIEHFFDVFVL
jgi:hypothetical protein